MFGVVVECDLCGLVDVVEVMGVMIDFVEVVV